MNGRRAKQLRREFKAAWGREPSRGLRKMIDSKEAINGMWHNAYDFHGMLYGVETMMVVEPSEWRHLKRMNS